MKIFEMLLLCSLVGCALSVCFIRDLLTSIVVFMSYSLIMAVIWVLLQSPDLAITEAAVGAGVTSILFFVTLKKIHAVQRDEGGAPAGLEGGGKSRGYTGPEGVGESREYAGPKARGEGRGYAGSKGEEESRGYAGPKDKGESCRYAGPKNKGAGRAAGAGTGEGGNGGREQTER